MAITTITIHKQPCIQQLLWVHRCRWSRWHRQNDWSCIQSRFQSLHIDSLQVCSRCHCNTKQWRYPSLHEDSPGTCNASVTLVASANSACEQSQVCLVAAVRQTSVTLANTACRRSLSLSRCNCNTKQWRYPNLHEDTSLQTCNISVTLVSLVSLQVNVLQVEDRCPCDTMQWRYQNLHEDGP